MTFNYSISNAKKSGFIGIQITLLKVCLEYQSFPRIRFLVCDSHSISSFSTTTRISMKEDSKQFVKKSSLQHQQLSYQREILEKKHAKCKFAFEILLKRICDLEKVECMKCFHFPCQILSKYFDVQRVVTIWWVEGGDYYRDHSPSLFSLYSLTT